MNIEKKEIGLLCKIKGSCPPLPEDKYQHRRNLWFSVVAKTTREALDLAEKLYPGISVHFIEATQKVHNIDGAIFIE